MNKKLSLKAETKAERSMTVILKSSETKRQALIQAAKDGVKLRDIVESAILEYLDNHKIND